MKRELEEDPPPGHADAPAAGLPHAQRSRLDRRALPLARKRRGPVDAGGRAGFAGGRPHYAARPGEVYFINPRELHGMQAASAGCAYLAFVFPLSWLQFAVNDAAEEDCLRPLATRRARADNALPPAAARPAAVLLAQAAALAADPSPAAALALKALLLAVCRRAVPRAGLSHAAPGPTAPTPLRRIAGYLQQHCAEPLTLERMGAEFHMSPKYFSAWFQKHFARTFSDYPHRRAHRARQDPSAADRRGHRVGFPAGGFFGQQLFYPRFPPRCRLHPRAIPPPVPGDTGLRVQS